MVLFSARQKQILFALVSEPAGLSLKELEKQLQVSRRTLYREFSELRLYLEQNGLVLASQNGIYSLEGETENKAQLKYALSGQKESYSLPTSQRQNAVAALLLVSSAETKIASIASDLNVSEGTIQHDLQVIAESLSEYDLAVKKKKGVGVTITGSEIKRRQVLCGILLTELNEYSFLSYLTHHDPVTRDFFMTLLPYPLLAECNQKLKQTVFPQLNFYSDNQIISSVLMFAISILRFAHGAGLDYQTLPTEPLQYLGLTYKFFTFFDWKTANTKQQISKDEVVFLAEHLQNTSINVNSYDFENDDFSVMIQVREFVELVSTDYGWDFRRNPDFFKRLSKHIENLIKNNQQQLPNVQIGTLQRISDNYSRLYQTIKAQWQEVFFDKELTEPEVQLLLLYFANEYTNRSYQRGLRALVVCENGFSTSQILKSRLLKEVPEIQQIATSKVSQLDQINPREYDLILSTLELPGFPREYQVVSPLLLENDVAKIRNWLNSYQKKFTVDSVPTDTRKTEQLADPQILAHKAEQITLYNRIVTSCSVTSLPNTSETLSELTQAIVAQISNKYISQPDSVISGLLSRAELAPIGIPDTNLALLHTSNQGVKQPFFAIFELSSPLTLRAMDQELIAVKRLVVLLAPEKINHLTESTLGMISSLMIMNDENTALFQTASTKQLRSFLTQKFLDEIRK